jgi:Family of unknown function (DUF6262)
MTSTALADSRCRDVDQRRQRVVHVIAGTGSRQLEITISSVARAARVHRSFIHRHPDLRAQVLKAADEPHALSTQRSGVVSRRSLEADNLNLRETNRRLANHIADLERHLSEYTGEQAFHRTGLGAGQDHAGLENRLVELEQEVLDMKHLLKERDGELAAAREAHRQFEADINRRRE